MNRSPLPRRAVRRIERAGSSVYDWRDQELLQHVDPSGRIASASRVLSSTGAVASGAIIVVSGYVMGGWVSAAASAAIFMVALISSRSLPWWPFAIMALTAGTAPSLLPLWGGVAFLLLSITGGREEVTRLSATLWALLAIRMPQFADVALSVAVVAQVAALVYTGGAPFGRLSPKHLAARIQPPRPRLPWLVVLLKRKAIMNAPAEIQRKAAGGYGERATALALLGLPAFRRVAILHDAALPGAEVANADHIVVTRAGAFAMDSKVFRGEVLAENGDVVQVSGGERRSVLRAIQAAAWQANLVSQAIESPTRAVLVIHEARMDSSFQVALPDGRLVDVVSGADVLPFMRAQPAVLSGSDLASIEIALGKLDAYDGSASRLTRPLGVRGPKPEKNWGSRVRVVTVGQAAPTREQRSASRIAQLPQVVEAATPSPKVITPPFIQEMWERMTSATPVPLDDLDPSLTGIRPGTKIIVLSMSDGVFDEQEMIAVSPVCLSDQGDATAVVWIAHEVAWKLHVDQGRPVGTTQVSADRVFIASEGS